MRPAVVLAALASPLAASAAEEVAIRPEESIIAVVTHKGGFAAGKAHNHLVVASAYDATLRFDAEAPLETRFEIDFAASDLAVDPWDLQETWYPRLERLGVLDEPFSELKDKDRQKIARSMLADGQLDAERFPRIEARLVAVEEEEATRGDVAFPYRARLELEVHGRRVEQPFAARYESVDGTLVVEALGTYRFTDFGIEPFSAFFGAVKNEDLFHVYVRLAASAPAGSDP